MLQTRGALLTGLGMGAGLMYFLDPERGRRRRALVRDQVARSTNVSTDAVDTTTRDLANRAAGAAARVRAMWQSEPVDDALLSERVRARLGRLVSHPGAIDVEVTDGRVTLRGPVLASEAKRLVRGIERVRGVQEVVSALDEHETAEGVPALQGGNAETTSPSATWTGRWSTTTGVLAGTAATALAGYAVSRRGATKEGTTTRARDVMTSNPTCCTASMTLDQVARLMVQSDCGEIPVVDQANRPVGVITDRDIVCRVVAEGKNPVAHTAEQSMTRPAVTVHTAAPLDEVLSSMEEHQIRRILVVDEDGCCAGIIAQADIAAAGAKRDVAELVQEVSRATGQASR